MFTLDLYQHYFLCNFNSNSFNICLIDSMTGWWLRSITSEIRVGDLGSIHSLGKKMTSFQQTEEVNSCWNIFVLHNLLPILITSPCAILNSPINSFSPVGTAWVLTSDNFLLIFPSFLSSSCSPGGSYQKLSCDAIFTVYSHTFIFF